MTARALIPIAECGLLTRRNAMRWCGQMGDERFDREVASRCAPRYIGQERFYAIEDLRAWRDGLPIDRTGSVAQGGADDWETFRNDLHKGARHQGRQG